jgi:long-chain acyl-CoA synthetase
MEKRTLLSLLHATAAEHPDQVYMRERHANGWKDATFREVEEEATAVAGFLLGSGLQRGERVTLLAEGRNSWIAAEFGVLFAGGISVPISVKIKEKNEILFRMKHSASRFAITSEMHFDKIAGFVDELPDLSGILVMDELAVQPAANTRIPVWSWAQSLSIGRTFARGSAALLAGIERGISEDDPVTLTYTSGTTAEPKGILLSHKNYVANVMDIDRMFPLPEPLYMLLILPWDHAFGQTVGLFTFLRKASVIAAVEPSGTELGTIRNIPRCLKEIGPTYLIVVPALVENFRKRITAQVRQRGGLAAAMFFAAVAMGTRVNGEGYHKRYDPISLFLWPVYLLLRSIVRGNLRRTLGRRLVFMVSGGSACSIEHVRWFAALGIPVYQGYGLSETSPVISSNTSIKGHFKMGSSGRPFPWAQIRIAGEDGCELAHGKTGEIWVRGECVMLGYWRNDEATKEAFTDGWFRTGDLGYIDLDGFLFVVGRIKSLLVGENGEKYSPESLEQHLVDTVPFIMQVMLYNQQNPFTVALVVPDIGEIREFMSEKGLSETADSDIDAVLEALRKALMRYRSDPVLTSLFVCSWTPKTFALLPEPFSEENGMMNASLKIVRRKVVEGYQRRLRRLYGAEEEPLNPENRGVLRRLLAGTPP